MRLRWGWGLVCFVTALAFVVMLGPIAVVLAEAFDAGDLMRFPPRAWSLHWFGAFLSQLELLQSCWVSFSLAAMATAISLLLGTGAAFALVRLSRRRHAALETLLLAPLYTPRVLVGMALLLAFAFAGVSGSIAGLLAAHVLITLPYVVRSVSVSLHGMDPAVEEAARMLGASRLQSLRRVTLPLARSGLVAGGVFAFVVSISDIYLAMFISGPQTVTLPLRMFNIMVWDESPLVAAAAAVQVIVVVGMIVAAESLVGLSKAVRA